MKLKKAKYSIGQLLIGQHYGRDLFVDRIQAICYDGDGNPVYIGDAGEAIKECNVREVRDN